jgi:uncharacterized membrane protein
MQPTDWEPTEMIKIAWERFGSYALVLSLAYLIEIVITQGLTQAPIFLVKLTAKNDASLLVAAVNFACSMAGMVIGAFFLTGVFRMALGAARGKPVQLGTLFMGGDQFPAMLGVYFIMGFGILLGTLLLVVPGVLLAFGWSLAPLYVADQKMGAIAALKASWEATKGQKGKLFVLGVLSFLIVIAGLFALCLGMFPAVALTYVAWAAAYTRISGREPAYVPSAMAR